MKFAPQSTGSGCASGHGHASLLAPREASPAATRRCHEARVNRATREEELEPRVHLESVPEVELLNGLFHPRRLVGRRADLAVDD